MLPDITLSVPPQTSLFRLPRDIKKALLLHLTCCLIEIAGNGGLLQNLEISVSWNKKY